MHVVLRMVAILVGGWSLVLIASAVYGLAQGGELAGSVAWLAPAFDQRIAADDWLLHWRVAGFLSLVFGLFGLVATFALWTSRPWARRALALLLTLPVAADLALAASGFARYSFELLEPTAVAAQLGLAAVAWLWALRARG
jgi:hypothetical protein